MSNDSPRKSATLRATLIDYASVTKNMRATKTPFISFTYRIREDLEHRAILMAYAEQMSRQLLMQDLETHLLTTPKTRSEVNRPDNDNGYHIERGT